MLRFLIHSADRAPLPRQLMKVTDLAASRGDRPVFICDFSPPRFADWNVVQRAADLSADFLCVAYNPGKAVRVTRPCWHPL